MILKIISILVVVASGVFLFAKDALKPITYMSLNPLRGNDVHGSGSFGASRGDHTHQGLDFKIIPNTVFNVPFDCKVLRYGYVYDNDLRWRLVEIIGTKAPFLNYKCKLMYLTLGNTFIGQELKKFDNIGLCQDISVKYPNITPHVHLELRSSDGQILNPSFYLD